MKRILSSFSALLMLLILILSFNTASFAASKIHVEDALLTLENKTGYIPGKTSSVVNNCFGFVSDVCEQLYGISFYYEQQDGNYQFKHTSGNYYTVAVKTYPYSSNTDTRKSYAKQIKEWLLLNAAPGDVLQYGCADPNYSKKHTVIIQHIDDKKIQVLHSNYETNYIPSTACRLDDIYWDSFLNDPMNNDYDGDTLHSLNLLFGSPMKLTGGMGMSLNRFTDLESKYYLDVYSQKVPEITKTERTSISSIKIEWTKLSFASKYCVEKKLSTESSWTTVSGNVKSNSYNFTGLTTGGIYQFRVRAYIQDKWYNYSAPVTKSAVPPKPGTVNISNSSPYGVTVSWAKRNDITGCIIYRSTALDGAYSNIGVIRDNTTVSFVDKTAKYNTDYYYKVQRYVDINGKRFFSEYSNPVHAKYIISAPKIGTERKTSSSVRVYWDTVENAVSYTAYAKNTVTGKAVALTSTSNEVIFNNLEKNCYYDFSVIAVNSIGKSDAALKTLQTLPPTPSTPVASLKNNGILVSWNARQDINGSIVYRSTSQNGAYKEIARIENNKTSSYLDTNISYGKNYYYKIVRYENYNGAIIYSPKSKAVCKKMTLQKPDASAQRYNTTSIKVKWGGVDNASSYTVRYKADGDKKYTYITATKKSCIIKKLTTGKTYKIYVRAENSIGNSDYCKALTIKAMPAKPLASLKLTSNAVKLNWDKQSDVSGYKIYRASSKNGKYELIKDITNKNTSSYSDKSVKYSNTYYYKIRSYVKKNGKAYYSSYSSVKSIKCSLSKPKNLSVKKKTSTSVTISWDSVQGAEKYIIYYKQENGKWKEISSKNTSKVIKSLKKGKKYYFRVKASNSLGIGDYSSVSYTVK
ncbi:MAG: fibronectin type III domain-containing protein [Eubacterium sp.]